MVVGMSVNGVMVKCMAGAKRFDPMDRCGMMENGVEDNPFDRPMKRGVDDHEMESKSTND